MPLKQPHEILNTLASDIETIMYQLEKGSESQTIRRIAFFTVFNFIETSIKILRTEFNPHKNTIVRDRKKAFITGNLLFDGRKILRDVPLDILVEDTLALINHTIGEDADRYKLFIELIPVRKRLLNPTSTKDLHLSDKETVKLINIFAWLKRIFLAATQKQQPATAQ